MTGAIISLPVLANKQDQLEAVVSILNREVSFPYRKGIQIFCGSTDRNKDADYMQTVRDIKSLVPETYSITWHAPFGLRNPTPEYNFIDGEAKKPLRDNIAIAEELSAHSIICHLTTSFYHPNRQLDDSNGNSYPKEYWERYRWRSEWNNYSDVKRDVIDIAYEHLRDVARSTSLKIAVENMPITLTGDTTIREEELMFDPKMHTPKSIRDFLIQMKNLVNVGICLDTSHYELMRRTLDLAHIGFLDLQEGMFTAVNYPEILGEQLSLEEFTSELLDTGRLYEVQLAGAGKLWLKDTHTLEEGTGIDLANQELLKVARFVALSDPEIPISFDIDEPTKNYLKRPAQVRSLKNFFEYMDKT